MKYKTYDQFGELAQEVQSLPEEKQRELCLIIQGYIVGVSTPAKKLQESQRVIRRAKKCRERMKM